MLKTTKKKKKKFKACDFGVAQCGDIATERAKIDNIPDAPSWRKPDFNPEHNEYSEQSV